MQSNNNLKEGLISGRNNTDEIQNSIKKKLQ
jgi:hypothetical protein